MAARSSARSLDTCCLDLIVSSGNVKIRENARDIPAPAPVATLRKGEKCTYASLAAAGSPVGDAEAPQGYTIPKQCNGGKHTHKKTQRTCNIVTGAGVGVVDEGWSGEEGAGGKMVA